MQITDCSIGYLATRRTLAIECQTSWRLMDWHLRYIREAWAASVMNGMSSVPGNGIITMVAQLAVLPPDVEWTNKLPTPPPTRDRKRQSNTTGFDVSFSA